VVPRKACVNSNYTVGFEGNFGRNAGELDVFYRAIPNWYHEKRWNDASMTYFAPPPVVPRQAFVNSNTTAIRSKGYDEPCFSQLLDYCPENTPRVSNLRRPLPGNPGKGRNLVPRSVVSSAQLCMGEIQGYLAHKKQPPP